MQDRNKTIRDLEYLISFGGASQQSMVMQIATDALVLLKEQEESIPVSWLKEKLEGHPELPYAVTDGISNVLDLWEGR